MNILENVGTSQNIQENSESHEISEIISSWHNTEIKQWLRKQDVFSGSAQIWTVTWRDTVFRSHPHLGRNLVMQMYLSPLAPLLLQFAVRSSLDHLEQLGHNSVLIAIITIWHQYPRWKDMCPFLPRKSNKTALDVFFIIEFLKPRRVSNWIQCPHKKE